MKCLNYILFLFSFSLVNTSCTHKLMDTLKDANKLEINKIEFVGKPLKVLIKEISPKIKMVVGNPTNTFNEYSTYIQLFFVSKQEFELNNSKGIHSPRIKIVIEQDFKHPPIIPLEKPDIWNNNKLKLYGDLIVKDIHITDNQ